MPFNVNTSTWVGTYRANEYPYTRDFLNSGRSPDNLEMLYSEATWTEVNDYYYLTSLVARTNCLAGYNLCGRNTWSVPSVSVLPDWESKDHAAPSTWIDALPEFSRNYFFINWNGYDNGLADILGFTLQHRLQGNANWISIAIASPTTHAYQFMAGTPGLSQDFRVNAYDELHNTESWPVNPDYDMSTKYFTWKISGSIADNRENELDESTVTIDPAPMNSLVVQNARFNAWMSTTGNHTISVATPGFSSPPIMSLPVIMDLVQDYFLAPLSNLISNGDLETGNLDGWTSAGSLPVSANTTEWATGTKSAELGDDCGGFCLGEPEIFANSDTTARMVMDTFGGLHVLYYEGTPNTQRTMRYRYRSPAGTWSDPDIFDEWIGSDSLYMKLFIDDAQTIHAFYKFYNSGHPGPTGNGVAYKTKPLYGEWSDTAIYQETSSDFWQTFFDVTVDHTGKAYILCKTKAGGSTAKLSLIEILPDGTWLYPVVISDDFRTDQSGSIHVNDDGSLLVTWVGYHSLYPNIRYQRVRNPEGDWSPSILIPVGGSYFTYSTWIEDQLFLFQNLSFQYLPPAEGITNSTVTGTGINKSIFIQGSNQEVISYLDRSASNNIDIMLPGRYWSETHTIPDDIRAMWITPNDRISIIRSVYGSGVYEAQFLPPGQADIDAEASLSQTVTIPADMNQPTLAFNTQISGGSPLVSSSFQVLIDDGMTETSVFLENTNHLWQHHWVAMDDYLGDTVTVKFILYQKVGDPIVHVDLDDVSLAGWETPFLYSVTADQCSVDTSYTVTGANLIQTPTLYLDDVAFPSDHVTWINSTTVTFIPPDGTLPGFYELTLINPGGVTSSLSGGVIIGCTNFIPMVLK